MLLLVWFVVVLFILATLKFDFAKVVTLGATIGQCLEQSLGIVLATSLSQITSKQHKKWIPVVVKIVCKSIAVTIAWYIQKVISAVQSAIRGGLMFSRSMMRWAIQKGYMADIDHEDTMMDEIVGWTIAAIGVYFQLNYFFDLPFPLNILLAPVKVVEWVIIWFVAE